MGLEDGVVNEVCELGGVGVLKLVGQDHARVAGADGGDAEFLAGGEGGGVVEGDSHGFVRVMVAVGRLSKGGHRGKRGVVVVVDGTHREGVVILTGLSGGGHQA